MAALLTLLVAVGLHARLSSPAFGSHSKSYDTVVAASLEVVVVTLLVLLRWRVTRVSRLSRFARVPRGAQVGDAGARSIVPARLRVVLAYVLGASAAALAVVLIALQVDFDLVFRPMHVTTRSKPLAGPGHPRPVPPAVSPSFNFPFVEVLYALLAAALVAVVVALVLREWRRRPVAAVDALPALAEEDLNAWHETLVGGQRALLEVDDTRVSIIACYSAMAEGLARAGTERSPADTPDELLAKVAGALEVSAGAARRLTNLFYEARFSTHPMGDAERTVAREALDELVTDLANLGGHVVGPLVSSHGDAVPIGAV